MNRERYADEPEPMPVKPGSDVLVWRIFAPRTGPVDDWSERDAEI